MAPVYEDDRLTRGPSTAPPIGGQIRSAAELLHDQAVEVLSLDVFDTLVWRAVPDPADALVLLGERLRLAGRLAVGLGPAQFRRLRLAAERRARDRRLAQGRSPEVSILEIWEEIPASAVAGSSAELVREELTVERELLRADLDVVELIGLARGLGKRVIAVSDTYLSVDQVCDVALSRKPLSPDLFAEVVTSSSSGQAKARGLFDEIVTRLDVSPAAILHLGDDPEADVASARAAGLRAVALPRRSPGLEHALRHERAYGAELDLRHGDFGLTSLRAKAATRPPRDLPEADRPYFRWGAAHLGPVLTGFASWVCERTQAVGAATAFCLMRDGALLAPLIEAAAHSTGAPMNVRRLWLSREVLARASIERADRSELDALLDRRPVPTLRQLGVTLGVDVLSHRELAGFADARLDDAGVRDLALGVLCSDPETRATVVAQAARLRERIIRTVTEELAGEERLVLVDIGWAATIQRALGKLLAGSDAGIEIHGLYLATRWRSVDGILDGTRIEGYLAHLNEPAPAVDTISRSPELFEQLCMPDHGTQVSINADGSPILSEDPADEDRRRQRALAAAGVTAFQHLWFRYNREIEGGLPPLADSARPQLLSIAARVIAAPSVEEATAFGGWLHEENHGSSDVGPVAAPVKARVVRHIDPRGLWDLSVSDVYWPFGLAALQEPELGRALELVSLGLVGWEAFASDSDTGAFEVFPDLGSGFLAHMSTRIIPRRNQFGLSYIRAHVLGDGIVRLRIDPTEAPALIRIDWLSLHCWIRGRAEPHVLSLEAGDDFEALAPNGVERVAPRVFLSRSSDPQLVVDLGVDGRVYFVDLECGFATVALPQALEYGPALPGAAAVERKQPAGAPVAAAPANARRVALPPLRRRLLVEARSRLAGWLGGGR